MSTSLLRDPRLALPWFRLTTPSGSVEVVTPIRSEQEKRSLGIVDGLEAYRDGLGRVGRVPSSRFKSHAVRLSATEASAILPSMSSGMAALRFPELAVPTDGRKLPRASGKAKLARARRNSKGAAAAKEAPALRAKPKVSPLAKVSVVWKSRKRETPSPVK